MLAAGRGRRLGGPKALLAWPAGAGRDWPLAAAHAERRLAAESDRVLVVTRPDVASVLAAWLPPGAELVESTAAEQLGPAGSVAAAMAVGAFGPFVLVTPVDTVPAEPGTASALLDAVAADERCWAARPRWQGRGGHPIALRTAALERYRRRDPPPLRDHLAALGARVATVSVADPMVVVDIDTPDDLAQLGRPPPRFLAGPGGREGPLRP